MTAFHKQNRASYWISSCVILVSIVVMAGWFLDIGFLKSIHPRWVTMKFSTALSFFLSGATLYFVGRHWEGDSSVAQLILPITTLGLLLLMATLLVSSLFNVRTGIEDLFVREAQGAVMSTMPGRPSIGTMLCFIFMAAAGVLTMLGIAGLKVKLMVIGTLMIGMGGLAVLGYLLDQPHLYYAVEGGSTAMALHTAILFAMLGMGIVSLTMVKERKTRFVSIRRKFLVVFLTISIIPMAFVGTLIYSNARNTLERATLERLRLDAEFKEAGIFLLLDTFRIQTKILASDGFLVSTLMETGQREALDGAFEETLSDYLREKKLLNNEILSIDVLDGKGRVIASSEPEMVGLEKGGELYFQKGMEELFVKDIHDEFQGGMEADFASPIRTGAVPPKTLGVLVVHYDASTINKLMAGELILEKGALTQAKAIGEGGETYLVSNDRMIVASSSFAKAPFSGKIVDTWPVRMCVEEHREVTGEWLSYRGNSVIGASMCIHFESIHWTLVSEQNKAEVFGAIEKLKNIAIFITILSMFLVVFVALSTARSISGPMEALHKGVEMVGQGNLDHKVGIAETDEIGRLSSAFDQMAHRLKTTMEDLHRLKEDAEEANRMKSNFLANISHELRTPLTSLVGFPDVIRAVLEKYPDCARKDIETALHSNEIISTQSKKLLAIIDDLIDLSKFEAGNFVWREEDEREHFQFRETPILAHSLIRALINVFLPMARKKGLTLSDNRNEQDDFSFLGDLKYLEKILFKILDNAVKFSEKGNIKLSLFPRGDQVFFQVSDEGVGLTEEEAMRAFERFHQIDGSSTRRQGGLGIGLDLVKKLVENMGGGISLRSVKGEGTLFTIKLPWKHPEFREF